MTIGIDYLILGVKFTVIQFPPKSTNAFTLRSVKNKITIYSLFFLCTFVCVSEDLRVYDVCDIIELLGLAVDVTRRPSFDTRLWLSVRKSIR